MGLVGGRDCTMEAAEEGRAGDAVMAAAALPPVPERRTRLVHIPITVSLIGSWSTRKLNTGSWRNVKKTRS